MATAIEVRTAIQAEEGKQLMNAITWVVELEFATPEPPSMSALDALDAEGDPIDRYVGDRLTGPGLTVSAYLTADDPGAAAERGRETVTGWLRGHGLDPALVGLRVLTEDAFNLEANTPTYPDLVSPVEVADMLGVTRQRVHQLWRDHPDFPEPLYELRTGPLWVRAGVEKFGRDWARQPGRPKQKAS